MAVNMNILLLAFLIDAVIVSLILFTLRINLLIYVIDNTYFIDF